VHGGLAHRHRHLRAAAVVDGVVQQFGEGVLGHARHLRRQGEEGRKVARPGQVFLQPGEVVALHHLAQRAGLPAHVAWRAFGHQPLRGHQLAQQRQRGAAADGQPCHQQLGQIGTRTQRGGGDPLRDGGKVVGLHGNVLEGAGQGDSTPRCAVSARMAFASARKTR
jgi:hypothetical protein